MSNMKNIKMNAPSLYIPVAEDGFQKYLAEVKLFPLLTPEEEIALANDLRENHSKSAAHRLITSHLRLVVAIASKYKGYGLPIVDLVAEGNIGLMQAVKKFDPDKGFRLATYAMWWIRASIQEYILKSWSLVKIGTTTAQKKLFFGLNKAKKRIKALEAGDLRPEHVAQIADEMNVADYEVVDMNRRLGHKDLSLNVPMIGHEGTISEWQDRLEDESDNQEIVIAETQEERYRKILIQEAMAQMSEREQEIIKARKLTDPPIILEELSEKFSISRERVRQIEVRAFEKLKENVQKLIEYRKPKLLE